MAWIKPFIQKWFCLPPMQTIIIAVPAFALVFLSLALHKGGTAWGGIVSSFYMVIISIVQAIKFRKHSSMILRAAKNINLTAAMVSMIVQSTRAIRREVL